MRSSDLPYLADWFAVSLRWLALLGLATGLALSGGMKLTTGAVLLFGALWNVSNTILAIQNRRIILHRPLNLLADVTIAMVLFQNNGGVLGNLPWSGVLPLFTATVYYGITGGLGMAVLVSLLQVGLTLLYAATGKLVSPLLVLSGVYLALGLVFGFVSHQLMKQIRQIYQNMLRTRQEAEHKAALVERNRMQTLMSMVETITSNLNYRSLLDALLDICTNAVSGAATNEEAMISVVMLFGDHDLRVEAARGLSTQDMRQTFPAEAGLLRDTLKSGESRQLQNPSSDPEIRRIMAIESSKSALTMPLQRGVNAYGMILFAHADPTFFNQDRVDLLSMIAEHAVIAIQNARLYQDLELEKERIVQTQEEARKQLARNLHDGPIQSVAAIAMRVDVARHLLSRNVNEANHELGKIEDLARRTTKELRHMLFTLRPLALETEGLIAALKAIAEKTIEIYQQNVQIDVDQATVDQLELGKQTVVFYLVEEAINNARKHAHASLIIVRLHTLAREPGIALLDILDNGQGFNVQEVLNSYEQRSSLGMINLRERTDLINGLLNIDSAPGKGTRVRIFIPLTEAAAERMQRGKAAKQN